MTELEIVIFEIENLKAEMDILFRVADETEKNRMLEELRELVGRRNKLLGYPDDES